MEISLANLTSLALALYFLLTSLQFVESKAVPLTSLTINDLISIYFQEIQSLGIVFLDLDSWDLYSSVCMGHGYCLCYSYLGDFLHTKQKKKEMHVKIKPAFSS